MCVLIINLYEPDEEVSPMTPPASKTPASMHHVDL